MSIFEEKDVTQKILFDIPVEPFEYIHRLSPSVTLYLDDGQLHSWPQWAGVEKAVVFYIQHTAGHYLFIPADGRTEFEARDDAVSMLEPFWMVHEGWTASVIESWLPAHLIQRLRTCGLCPRSINQLFVALRHPDEQVRERAKPVRPPTTETADDTH